MDPSTLGNYTYMSNEEFLTRWHDAFDDEQFYGPGIVVSNPSPSYNPGEYKHLG